jgi:hypothetical protein
VQGPLDHDHSSDQRAGFNLIQMSILLTVASIAMVSALPSVEQGGYYSKAAATIEKMRTIEQAAIGFMAANGRRPCPADGQYGVDAASFGKEAGNPGTCTGGSPAAPFGPDAGTGYIVGGTVPTKTLGLPDEYAFDEWGRRITYIVDKRATKKYVCGTLQNYPHNAGTGGIAIKNSTGGSTIENTMYAYISHGADGHGAFPMQGSTVANRINTGSIDTDSLTNSGVNASFTYDTANFTNVKVKKEKTATFDDVLYYADYAKNTCCIGTTCVPIGFRIDGEAGNRLGNIESYNRGLKVMDLNADGYDDLLLASHTRHWGWILFGKNGNWASPFLTTSLDGTNGFALKTSHNPMNYYSGDFDGDGYKDLMTSSWGFGNATIIIFGHQASYPAAFQSFAPSTFNGTNGSVIGISGVAGAANTQFVGKFSSTLYEDFIAFGSCSNNNYWVFRGRPRPWPASTTLGGQTLGSQLIGFTSSNPADCGYLNAGDFNDDGFVDLFFSVWNPTRIGHVINGGEGPGGSWSSGYAAENVNTPGNPDGILLNKPLYGAYWVGRGVGDINNDGVTDLFAGDGDGTESAGGPALGRTMVIFGDAALPGSSWPPDWNSSTTLTGANGFRLVGSWTGSNVGLFTNDQTRTIDVNGDGLNDLVFPVNLYGDKVHILFGAASYSATYFGNTAFNGATGSVVMASTCPENWGHECRRTIEFGDVNGDGVADMLLSQPRATVGGRSRAGHVAVVFGRTGAWPATINWTDLDGTNGFIIEGQNADDYLGYTAALANLNGDDYDDVIACAPYADNNGADSGSCYVLYGKADGFSASYNASEIQ